MLGTFAMAKGPSIKLVREIVRLGVHGIPTSLEAWMRDHFTDLKNELPPHRANWSALAERLGRAGLTNALGGELTAHTARKTWQRVRDTMDEPPPSQGEAPTGSQRRGRPEAASPIVEPLESDDLPPRHTFTPAKIR
jgi:hypothetical protein